MGEHTLLFLGYQVTELDFRVILRAVNRLWRTLRAPKVAHYTFQIIHVGDFGATSDHFNLVKGFYEGFCSHCAEVQIEFCHCTTRDFIIELGQRWEIFKSVSKPTK
jgi:hypothetical protein